MTRNWGQFLIAIPKAHPCFLPTCVLCCDGFQVSWVSHLEGRAGPLRLLSHLSHRSTFHSTPRALPLSLELGSQVGAVAGLRHSGAHSQSAHLGRCTGICSSAGRSLRFGKWPRRTHSYLLLSLEYWGNRAERARQREKKEHNAFKKLQKICQSCSKPPKLFIFLVETVWFLIHLQ